jgi:hypothetical protein
MLFAVGGYIQHGLEEGLEIRDRHDRSPYYYLFLVEKAGAESQFPR